MKAWHKRSWFLLAAVLLALGWIVYFHNTAVASRLPKWGWVQATIGHLGPKAPVAAPEDEDPDTTTNNIPVHTAHISVATLHRYIDGFGTVAPRPPRLGQMAGGANIASPVAGVVASVLCQAGKQVHAGDPVIQLDDRVAKSVEEQASAALTQTQASLAALKAIPRPDQLQIAQLGVDKAQSALQFAEKNYNRLKQLATEQGASGKSVEQAAMDLAAARTDLAVAQKQLSILKSTPTPEDLHQEQAKVAQASAALVTAKVQHQMMTITAPIDATVVQVSVNPGESVDTTRILVQLVAADRLMVDVDVPADQLPAAAEGLSAQILPSWAAPSADGSNLMIGKVSFVSPQVDPRNGSVMVGIDLPPGAVLRSGLAVRVRIIAEEHKDVLAVPREAVVADENGDSVIAIVADEQATRKTVKAGLEEGGLIEISADGLKEGDTVVTAGAYGLPQATRVKVLD
jgi:multidrug efflux pump subunit AcrA (membrane-fusion protein)